MSAAAPTRLKEAAISTRDAFLLDPKSVRIIEGFNARDYTLAENQAHLQFLKESIKEVGVQNPIIVRWVKGEIHLVDGECRLRATLLALEDGAQIAGIPAIQEQAGTTEAERILSIDTRNSGKRLSPIERAEVYGRLVKMGQPEEWIAKGAGVSVAYVRELLELRSAPESVKEAIRAKDVSASVVMDQIKAHGGDVQAAAAAVTSGVAAAKAAGKKRAGSRDVANAARLPYDKRNYSREDARCMVKALMAIYKRSASIKEARDICDQALQNVGAL